MQESNLTCLTTGYGGIVLIMPPFRRDFGTCITKPDARGIPKETCTLTALQQSLVSLTFLFVAAGGAIAGPVGHFLGRRGAIQLGCVLVAIGAGGMLGTTGNYTAYMVCKCIGGVGLGFFNAAAPAYAVECTTPTRRGMLTSLFGFGLGCGSAIAAAVCLGTSKFSTSLAWQTPIICQIPLALILGLGVMLFPESPRWLLLKGKETQAKRAFARFYGVDSSSALVAKQVQEVQLYIEHEQHTATTTSWTELFHKTNIRRTMISWLVSIGQAICGGKFVSVYASLFLSGVGISNPYLITVIVVLMAVAGGVILPFVTEYGGRRFAVITGYCLAASCMLIIGTVATGLGASSSVAKNVLIVFLCLWTFIYGGLIGASFPVIAPEMYTVRLRTSGMASTATVYEIFAFAAAFYTPYMLNKQYGNMGTNVAYFYFGMLPFPLCLRSNAVMVQSF